MTEHYRKLVKLIRRQEEKKYWMFNNVKGLAENVSERTQNKFFNGQNIIIEKYNFLIKKLNNQTNIIQDLNVKPLEPSTLLPKRVVKWWGWYHQLTGLDTVEAAKQQVIVLQDKLFECHDNRRLLNKQMTDITLKLQEVYGELIQTKRDDPKYVHLTIVENKNLQEQNKIINTLALLEKEEKDKFTQLATAIKEYHDNQNMSAQKYKYLSIIASVVVAMVSLIGSIIINNQKIYSIKNAIYESQGENKSLIYVNTNQLTDLQNKFHSFETKFLQNIHTNKEKEINKENNTSNILTSAKHVAHLVISGTSYIISGTYTCGLYVIRIFTG
ncbi:coiled-coil domain-containing protein 51-like [Harpegnathos saltator]|uniref:coiled-coil domain-containing protein 51-like n=1 Tax=Harpegnathos saltator TaxID=610380 RepID=UPI00058E2C7A|nr:coiled-coil domain-containing protein 51-like [Harpegnathos saltator]